MTHRYREGDEPIPGAGYRLIDFLGRGGFGEVWKARGPGGAEVALKIIPIGGAEGRTEFRSLQLVKRLHHPCLLPVHGFWVKARDGTVLDESLVETGRVSMLDTRRAVSSTARTPATSPDPQSPQPAELVIAMGLGERSLFERLQECLAEGRMGIPLDELLGYMDDAARAVDFLNRPIHDLGAGPVAIQHCDIKPHNLLIVGGALQVCDFGLARMLGSDRTTSAAATIAYAAPECLASGKASPTTDQYSLAVSYFEMRTGRLPYSDEALAAVVEAKRSGDLNLSALPPGEQAVVQRALAADPAARFPSACDMVRALREAAQSPPAAPPSIKKPRSTGRFVAWTVLAAVVLAVVSGMVAWRYGPGSGTQRDDAANVDALLRRGTESLDRRQAAEAIAAFTEALALAPADARLYSRRGAAWLLRGEYAEAVDDSSRALAIAPDARDRINRGRAYLQLQRFDEALADFDEAVRLDRSDADAVYFRAELYQRRSQFDKAVTDLDRAIELAPRQSRTAFSLADAYERRGLCHLAADHADDAVRDLTEALHRDPNDPAVVHGLRADALELKNRPEAAQYDRRLVVAWKAVRAKPGDPAGWQALAGLLANAPEPSLADPQKATEAAARASELSGSKDQALSKDPPRPTDTNPKR